ncbi:phosphate/phosphite/phosphonate ABC transporter substrate-binding protein [Oxalobacteraceae bacterium CAVE-383]|nr:phosphate/phosphite/phosphonate ABC transporter substrate-binding protein [Oxalobacteraceae bacterium CAVE-383]
MLPAFAAFAAPASAAPAACDRPARLHFSFSPQGNLQDNPALLQPLLTELSDVLHIPVESVSLPSYGAVIEGLLSGSVDIAKLGPASYTSVHQSDDTITPFATLSAEADLFSALPTAYYSLLIVRQQSNLSIESLKGKKLALVDPDSTSGALIPLKLFSRKINAPLTAYFSRVGYSGTHQQSVLSVAAREVDAAFVSSSTLTTVIREGRIRRDEMRVLWKSDPIPRDPFVFRGHLCPDIRQKIQKVFFSPGNPRVAAALAAQSSEKFVPVSDRDYKIIRDLQESDRGPAN